MYTEADSGVKSYGLQTVFIYILRRYLIIAYLPYLQLSLVYAFYTTLRQDNFVVLRLVYKTENSKVMVIFN